jgi:hypothetical protein
MITLVGARKIATAMSDRKGGYKYNSTSQLRLSIYGRPVGAGMNSIDEPRLVGPSDLIPSLPWYPDACLRCPLPTIAVQQKWCFANRRCCRCERLSTGQRWIVTRETMSARPQAMIDDT